MQVPKFFSGYVSERKSIHTLVFSISIYMLLKTEGNFTARSYIGLIIQFIRKNIEQYARPFKYMSESTINTSRFDWFFFSFVEGWCGGQNLNPVFIETVCASIEVFLVLWLLLLPCMPYLNDSPWAFFRFQFWPPPQKKKYKMHEHSNICSKLLLTPVVLIPSFFGGEVGRRVGSKLESDEKRPWRIV